MTDWQAIATAPDGTVLILGWWADFLGSVSWEVDVEYFDRQDMPYATHWLPIPAPPEQGA